MVGAEVVASLGLAVSAGAATFFSPCAYALLPGYVGFYASQVDEPTLRGTIARGVVAAAGTVLTLAVLVGIAFSLGQEAFESLLILEPVVGVALIGFGALVFAGKAPSVSVSLPARRSSILGFGIFGGGYAIAAAGCVAPVFLAVVLQALSFPAGEAALVVGTYVGSVALLMLSITLATGMGLIYGTERIDASQLVAYSGRIEQLAGAVMILAGIGQLYVWAAVSSPV